MGKPWLVIKMGQWWWGNMLKVTRSRWKTLLFTILAMGLGTSQALAGGYKGALLSDTLVFDVTYVSGGNVQIETWFAQWEGNVYSDTLDSRVLRSVGINKTRKVCENASWIAPERHIWREGDEPYLTRSQDLKRVRLEHSIKTVRCRSVTEETQGVSRRALKSAEAWLQSRQLSSVAFDRKQKEIASVAVWIKENVPGVVSIRLNTRKSAESIASLSK